MNKKIRRRLRELDKEKGVKKGTHEQWIKIVKPEVKNAILLAAERRTKK
jgi:hypothetical protein